ncbi:MAG: 5-dehydro-4-deoxy-D-glucuronate isomerase [Balneolaceae bacterium]|nr:5-dehydro-4-deoxy-D-glucuronate isomerase [Balneolaceae bacterium]MBO6547317.1 5-dehydro-4-deoxy-D-glucuronate isomerase [Balneolaceae bacterium]MBO6647736.1 5-dehydro-4-deoxy-D-glucuronate isomerase [Balneolaceae bacterium]
MSVKYKTKYACHPEDFRTYDTEKLRSDFLLDSLFSDNTVNLYYTHYDRFIVGGAKPSSSPLKLETIDPLKANYFLERREIGIINVGGTGIVKVGETEYTLEHKEALYIGRGAEGVYFLKSGNEQPLFYLNSAPAHKSFPTKKISQSDAEVVELGSLETANHRVIRKLIVNSIVETCQVQMGMTQLKTGSVWNTMPAHVHDRRMEAYFYFEVPEDQIVCHFLGEPQHTRHIWLKNNQAVLSPPWSIHCGSGTSNYTFIWGMAGENLDYGDMDTFDVTEMR